MRLSGWQRIGVIVSVIWIFAGGYLGNDIGIHEGDWVIKDYGICLKTAHPGQDERCEAEFNRLYPEAIKYHWYEAAFMAIVPIPVCWLLAWGLVVLFRWIKRGFQIK
jgi:hypothetical protein